MPVIDGDSHFMEPLDLFERYIDPQFRDKAMRVAKDPTTSKSTLVVEGRQLHILNVEELLAAVVGYGQKEEGYDLSNFDQALTYNTEWQDMDKRVRFLDQEGIDLQILYPTMGLLWEGGVDSPHVADALCRAYNTWAFEITAAHKNRLFPAAPISLCDSQLAVRELQRVAKLGCKTIFVAAMPINGHSFGHPDLDPVWAATQDLDLSVCIPLVGHRHYTGSQWYQDRDPGFMFVTMNVIQDPRMALTTMVYDGVFERFPQLRVVTIEAMVGWVGEWVERLNYRYKYMGHTSQMKRPASEYFLRNIWVNGDPEEKMFPLMVQFLGDERFFVGSDYPHAEGFVEPIKKARALLSDLPSSSVDRILGANAQQFFGI